MGKYGNYDSVEDIACAYLKEYRHYYVDDLGYTRDGGGIDIIAHTYGNMQLHFIYIEESGVISSDEVWESRERAAHDYIATHDATDYLYISFDAMHVNIGASGRIAVITYSEGCHEYAAA